MFEASTSTAHRYARRDWSREKNLDHYAEFYSEQGLGHNFVVRLKMVEESSIEARVVNPAYDISRLIDHRFVDESIPFFKSRVSSLENIAEYLFAESCERWPGQIEWLEVQEGDSLTAIRKIDGMTLRKVVRTRNHENVLDVALYFFGSIDSESGLIVRRSVFNKIQNVHLPKMIFDDDQGRSLARQFSIQKIKIKRAVDQVTLASWTL